MNLRSRLALASATSLLVAFALIAVLVYLLVARGLYARIDQQLHDQARQASTALSAATFTAPEVGDQQSPRELRRAQRQGGGLQPGSVPAIGSRLPARAQQRFIIAQRVSASGEVLAQSQALQDLGASLPVTDVTRAVAADGGEQIHGADVGTSRVRMLEQRGPRGDVVQVAVLADDVASTLQQLRRMLVVGGVLAALVAALVGWRLAGEALRPIGRIVGVARRITATRDVSQRIPAPTQKDDEVGVLAATINEMLAALEQAQQSQQRFVADASHELRTPLTSLQGNVEFLQREGVSAVDRDEVLGELRSDIVRLGALAGDLLELARADAGFIEQRADVDLSAVVQEQCARVQGADPSHPVAASIEPGLRVSGNEVAIGRAISNLLENAVRYTPAGTRIEVGVTRIAPGRCRVRVKDSGPGMSADDAARAFDRFHRAATSSGTDGTGLGLAIVRQVVRAHGGDVQLTTAPGAGCSFEVDLPEV